MSMEMIGRIFTLAGEIEAAAKAGQVDEAKQLITMLAEDVARFVEADPGGAAGFLRGFIRQGGITFIDGLIRQQADQPS